MSYETIIDGRLVRVTPVPFTVCRHCGALAQSRCPKCGDVSALVPITPISSTKEDA